MRRFLFSMDKEMQLDDDAKKAVQNIGDAINSAVGESLPLAEAIEHLRSIGYEANLTVRLEIALEKRDSEDDFDDLEAELTPEEVSENIELELTEEDLRTLRKMKIKF